MTGFRLRVRFVASATHAKPASLFLKYLLGFWESKAIWIILRKRADEIISDCESIIGSHQPEAQAKGALSPTLRTGSLLTSSIPMPQSETSVSKGEVGQIIHQGAKHLADLSVFQRVLIDGVLESGYVALHIEIRAHFFADVVNERVQSLKHFVHHQGIGRLGILRSSHLIESYGQLLSLAHRTCRASAASASTTTTAGRSRAGRAAESAAGRVADGLARHGDVASYGRSSQRIQSVAARR